MPTASKEFSFHLRKNLFMLGLGVLFAEFSRYLIRLGVPKVDALFQPIAPDCMDVQTLNPLTTKDTTAMAKNENLSFTFFQPVTINTSTNHNAPGGIIGSGPITVHQHFDKPQSPSPAPDAQTRDVAVADSEAETASLDQLLDYAETFMRCPLSENTIRNVLQRNAVESYGEEERGRARAKLYPKTQAEKAIADYVFASKKK